MMGTHQKLNYIHVFRAIAIIFIVAGHCYGIYIPNRNLQIFTYEIFANGTVLFVFIAGFLFQYLSDTFEYGAYLKKKFLNVVLPYLLLSSIGIALCLSSVNNNPFTGVHKLVQVFMFLITGAVHNISTWYIPMICSFFLIAKWLLKVEDIKIFKNKSLLFCLLPLLLLNPLLNPRPGLIYRDNPINAWEIYSDYMIMELERALFFFPIYVLGMFFAAKPQLIDKCYKYRNYLLIIFIGTTILSLCLGYSGKFSTSFVISKIVLAPLLLGLLKHYDAKILTMPRFNKAMGFVADYSFSIFFLHGYFWLLDGFKGRIFLPIQLPMTGVMGIVSLLGLSAVRFIVSFFGSLITAVALKKLLTKCGIKNTRWFIGA